VCKPSQVFAAENAIISRTTMAVKEIMKRQEDESIQDQRQELQSSSQLQDNNIFFCWEHNLL
jgi:hypothetical protein